MTIKGIYARVTQNLKNKMNRQQAEKETKRLVNWCLDKSETLNEEDGLALLSEFDEWIQYEAQEIDSIDFVTINSIRTK